LSPYENGEAGDWKEYRRLVLHELKKLSENLAEIEERLHKIDKDNESLNLRWGFATAIVSIIVSVFIALIAK
jgi:hypothetical protein